MPTPGPWVVDKNAPNQVAQPVLSKRRRISCPPDADGMLDARLVAAAPDLYAAAKKFLDDVRCLRRTPHEWAETFSDAIRKAEGRA